MNAVAIAFLMAIIGGGLAWLIWTQTEHEYSLSYWLSWSVAMGGLLVLAGALHPLHSRYLVWSTLLGLILTVLFLAGRVEDEFLPPAWLGAGILLANGLLLLLGGLFPTPVIGGILAVLAGGLLSFGWWLRRGERSGYDAAFSAAGIFAVVALMAGAQLIKTPLEYLNLVEIPRRNTAFEVATSRSAAFEIALQQAREYRAQIDRDFDSDAAYLDMVDQRIREAEQEHATAAELLAIIGAAEPPTRSYSADLQRRVRAQTEQSNTAAQAAQAALDRIGSVRQLYEQLAQEWTKEYLWFEVDGYWTSEENENPSYNVCYYGERVSTRVGDTVDEQIVSDVADRTGQDALFSSDVQGQDWKYFTVDDYNDLVNGGVVPAAPGAISSAEAAGAYLCGDTPQSGRFGALGEPPVVIEKEYGSLVREVGDEGASFVGNYRYGTWCTVGPDGQTVPIPEEQQPPADAQWCWYQKPGDSTNYYWERKGGPGSYIWIRSHRRCVYCTPQANWGGGELVPDNTLARTNGTDGSSIRGPLDQGGGPGTGK